MLYAVQMTEHAKGGRAESSLVGVFDTQVAASIALYKAFKKVCAEYGIDENLADDTTVDTDCSFYNEGKEFSIDILECGDVNYEVFGEITELELNKMCLDDFDGDVSSNEYQNKEITSLNLSEMTPEDLLNNFPYTEENREYLQKIFENNEKYDDEDYFDECYKVAEEQLKAAQQ